MNNKQTFYESPEVKVVDILAEGVLCSSYDPFGNGGDFSSDWEF